MLGKSTWSKKQSHSRNIGLFGLTLFAGFLLLLTLSVKTPAANAQANYEFCNTSNVLKKYDGYSSRGKGHLKSQVKSLQRAIKDEFPSGWHYTSHASWIYIPDVGTPDGYFGSRTENAVRTIQVLKQLDIDGKVGRQTRGVLCGGGSHVTSSCTVPWTRDTNLRSVPTNITGADLDHAIRSIRPDSPLIGLGNSVVATGNRYGINPVYIMSHAIWESEWGTSYIAQTKNNLFGFGAFTENPENAYTYSSFAHSVEDVMAFVDARYLSSGGSYYSRHGSTLRGMNVHYADDGNWANGIASVMNSLQNYLPNPTCR